MALYRPRFKWIKFTRRHCLAKLSSIFCPRHHSYHSEHRVGAVGARVDRCFRRRAGTHDHDFRHRPAAAAAARRLEVEPPNRGRNKVTVSSAAAATAATVSPMLSPRWLRLRCIPLITRATSQTATSSCRLAIPRAPLKQTSSYGFTRALPHRVSKITPSIERQGKTMKKKMIALLIPLLGTCVPGWTVDSVCSAASPPQGYSAAVAPGPCEAPPSRGSFIAPSPPLLAQLPWSTFLRVAPFSRNPSSLYDLSAGCTKSTHCRSPQG